MQDTSILRFSLTSRRKGQKRRKRKCYNALSQDSERQTDPTEPAGGLQKSYRNVGIHDLTKRLISPPAVA